MPKFEIELDDKSEFVGAVPAEIQGILERRETTARAEGLGKGYQKAAEEAKAQIASNVAAEKAKWEASLPLERAKWGEIEERNKLLTAQMESLTQEHRKTLTSREETHALETMKRVEALNKRNQKIEGLVTSNLRALAAQAGAREESLGELEIILKHRIGFDDDMEPFVKAEDGSPAKTTAGNPLPIDVFVKQYLDNHPHHRKPAPGRGGDARGGASLRAATSTTTTVDAARQRIEQDGDRSADAINDLYLATRKRA